MDVFPYLPASQPFTMAIEIEYNYMGLTIEPQASQVVYSLTSMVYLYLFYSTTTNPF